MVCGNCHTLEYEYFQSGPHGTSLQQFGEPSCTHCHGFHGIEAAGIDEIVGRITDNCQGCHLADGAGTPAKVPALKNEVGRFLGVEGGREYLVRVPGTSQSPLTDAEVAAVLNWILRNFSAAQLPADFVPFSAVEVARYRREPLTNAARVRASLLRSLALKRQGR